MNGKSIGTISLQSPLSWRVYIDGAANQRGFGVGLVLVSPEKITIEKSLRLDISATNNKAEYEAYWWGDHGAKNGQKGNRGILGFKIGHKPGAGGVRSQKCENAGIFESC